jgi:4-amino-4-deoxy-L-arabinose transferase-like glycosyltransferase
VAFLPRLFVALAWPREPVWDGHYYHFGAARIAEGLGYSEDVLVGGVRLWRPWCHYPVGYSGALAAVYRVFGTGLLVAPVTNAVIGTLLVVVVHRLALRALSLNRARIAAAITALHPGLIAYSAVIMNEELSALLVLSAAWVAVRRLGYRHTIAAGVLFGLGALVRPSSLLAPPLVALLVPLPKPEAITRGAVALAVALATILPWTVRNCRVMDGCALVSTNGGWNLAIGALTTTGRFQPLHARDGCPVVTGQVQQDRCWAEVGWSIIERDPLHWVGLAPSKLSQTYDHESFAIEYLREADPGGWPESRRVAGRALLSVFHQMLLVAAALGLVALPSLKRLRVPGVIAQALLLALVLGYGAYAALGDQHPFWVLPAFMPLLALLRVPGAPPLDGVLRFLLGLVFVTTLTHAVFFGDDRYHLVVTPAFAILAAAALRRLSQRPVAAGARTSAA